MGKVEDRNLGNLGMTYSINAESLRLGALHA